MSQALSSKQQSGFTVAKQTALYEQHLDKVFCDVIIKIKDEEFYVHSCIVAATCPKLHRLVDERKKPINPVSIQGPVFEVELDDDIFGPKVFEFILSYIYLGVLDWSKVAPGLINQVLDAANWCEFDQLIEDYMSMSQDEELQMDNIESSTIVMVDTCPTDESEQEDLEYDSPSDKIEDFAQDIDDEEIACNDHFELEDNDGFAEHMASRNQQPFEKFTSRPGVLKRKASLGVKEAYKSLIPCEKSSNAYSTDHKAKSKIIRKKKASSNNKGKIALFKKEVNCRFCGSKFSNRKFLKDHQAKECPWKEQPDVHLEPLSTEEIANHLLAELITGNGSNSNVLPSTRGVTVQTGTIIRPYKTKKNLEQNQGKPILEKKFKTAKLWICPRCPDVVFEKKRDQLNHIRTIHGVIKRHMCEHCGKSLDGKTALALHMRIHTGERPFVCPTCGRGFSERKTMEDHTRRHTGERPFLCTICGKDFGYRQSLYRHMKFHIGERPYQCDICSKTFVLKQNLQEHVARHNKHQLVSCGQCNVQFASKDLLLKHQLTAHVTTASKIPVYQDVACETIESARNISVLDMTEEGEAQVASYEVTIDNSVLESLAEE